VHITSLLTLLTGLNYNLWAVFQGPFVNFLVFYTCMVHRVILKLYSRRRSQSLYNGRWSPLLVGNRKMAARTHPVAVTVRTPWVIISSHYVHQWPSMVCVHLFTFLL